MWARQYLGAKYCGMAKPFHTFRRHLDEALTRADFEQLRKEAGAFTKNIRRIQNPQELALVMDAFKIWQAHFSTYVYDKLLGLPREGGYNGGYNFDKETWEAKNLRVSGWDLTTNSAFSLFVGYGKGIDDLLLVGRRFAYNDGNKSLWDAVYRIFDRQRDKVYSKLGSLIRKAFAAIEEYLKAHTDKPSFPDHSKQETVMVSGIPVHIKTSELIDSTAKIKSALQQIQLAIGMIRRKGLERGLHRLEIEMRPNSNDWEAAGHYSFNDRVVLHALGLNSYTTVHEIGHHFHLRALSEEQRTRWDQFIRGHGMRFTDEEFRMLKDAFWKAVEYSERHKKGFSYVHQQFWEHTFPAHIPSPDLLVKYQHFTQSRFGHHDRSRYLSAPWTSDAEHSNEDRWKEFEDVASKGFKAHVPTDYSNKNTEEAFCEVFAFYVHDRKLSDIVRVMIRDVCGLS